MYIHCVSSVHIGRSIPSKTDMAALKGLFPCLRALHFLLPWGDGMEGIISRDYDQEFSQLRVTMDILYRWSSPLILFQELNLAGKESCL